ncbi:MAG: sulfur carrier protein ThiS [Spirochaetia bacterium]|jgi:sulfur carrier protein|nr:sulfur carrier protein ThiS [Spirochaetia bacterium]
MKLIINGEAKEFSQTKLNVEELLVLENVEQPDMVSVQLNDEFLKKPDYAAVFLKDDDAVNFLYFMGGGE